MKNKAIEYKLKSYTALAASIIAVGSNADAQIIYTDINPDVVKNTGSEYMLDLNNDGTNDFKIRAFQFSSSGSTYKIVALDMFNSNEVLVSGYEPLALNKNDTISPNDSLWENNTTTYFTMNSGAYGGNWVGVSDKYLGLKIKVSGQTYYGWARLDVNTAATSFTIKDYAYESTPNKSILAGQTITDIKEPDLLNNISVYSHNKTLFVDLKDNNITDGVIKLYNIKGQEVKTVAVNNIRMEINVEDIKLGVYFIKVFASDRMFTEKIIIQ